MTDLAAGPMTGKTILITGGTGGIGYATAIGLARLGARVGIVGRDQLAATIVNVALPAIQREIGGSLAGHSQRRPAVGRRPRRPDRGGCHLVRYP